MPASMRVVLDMRRLQELARNFDGNTDKAVAALAHQALGEMQVRAPVDTGALRGSLHVKPVKAGWRWIGDGVEYGIYNEFGTSRMAAHPFFLPGLLAAVKGFAAAVKEWVFR